MGKAEMPMEIRKQGLSGDRGHSKSSGGGGGFDDSGENDIHKKPHNSKGKKP